MPNDVYDELGKIYQRLNKLSDQITELNSRVGNLEGKMETLIRNYHLAKTIIKWVVLPLIVILGGLIGIKIILPLT